MFKGNLLFGLLFVCLFFQQSFQCHQVFLIGFGQCPIVNDGCGMVEREQDFAVFQCERLAVPVTNDGFAIPCDCF